MTKTTKRALAWGSTGLLCLGLLPGAVLGLFKPSGEALQMMQQLGYPAYLFLILSVAKLLAIVAILSGKSRTLKEWAYAGLTFDFLGASASFAFIHGSALNIVMPLIFFAVLLVSYRTWKSPSFRLDPEAGSP